MSNANRINRISIIECAEFAAVATFCIILYYIVLYCITLYYIVLYCIILYFIVSLYRFMSYYLWIVFIVWLYLLYGCIYCMYWIYCVYCVCCMECMWFVNPLTRRSAGSRAALICGVNFCNKIFAKQLLTVVVEPIINTDTHYRYVIPIINTLIDT
nr:MAG: hypothetical protein AmFV_00184 [Apis mellifera filamentous virus]